MKRHLICHQKLYISITMMLLCISLMVTNIYVSIASTETNEETISTQEENNIISPPIRSMDDERFKIGLGLLAACIASALALAWQIRPRQSKKSSTTN